MQASRHKAQAANKLLQPAAKTPILPLCAGIYEAAFSSKLCSKDSCEHAQVMQLGEARELAENELVVPRIWQFIPLDAP